MTQKNFIWGAATSSYQIEGAAYADGKGLNIWDTFCQTSGAIVDNSSGDMACDHYNRFAEDVKLMKEIGIKAYRFSISWARILPDGIGEINQKGIDFYSKLVDLLLENGIEPYVTLYHWDLPYELHKKGGWLNPEISDWFANYARIFAENFSGRVKNYITINEPQVFVGLGYKDGLHAPGLKMSLRDLIVIGHNVLKAHGRAVQEIRNNSAGDVNVGIAMATSPAIPFTETSSDIMAARKVYEYCSEENFIFTDTFWLDPIVFGKYPDGIAEKCAEILGAKTIEEDMNIISSAIDFIGANIYQGPVVKAQKGGAPLFMPAPQGGARTAIGWNITPDALYWGARENVSRYGKPYIITENGMSAHDTVSLDGGVHDPNRIDYMQRYLRGFRRAAEENIDVAGYFAWSLMDNFEWAYGYSERFGLVYVDYATQERTLKDSAYWYKTIIESNGELL